MNQLFFYGISIIGFVAAMNLEFAEDRAGLILKKRI